jgi:hypothetical protein
MLKGNAGIEDQPAEKKTSMGLIAVFLTYFLFSLMTFGQNVAAPRIAADLNGMSLYSWAISLPMPP